MLSPSCLQLRCFPKLQKLLYVGKPENKIGQVPMFSKAIGKEYSVRISKKKKSKFKRENNLVWFSCSNFSDSSPIAEYANSNLFHEHTQIRACWLQADCWIYLHSLTRFQPAQQPLEVNEQSRIGLLTEGIQECSDGNSEELTSCLACGSLLQITLLITQKKVSVALTLRKCGCTAGWRLWTAGHTCADPVSLCQKLLVPEMGKELPGLAERERAWPSLANLWQHYTT